VLNEPPLSDEVDLDKEALIEVFKNIKVIYDKLDDRRKIENYLTVAVVIEGIAILVLSFLLW
jgi:hypothetical protein